MKIMLLSTTLLWASGLVVYANEKIEQDTQTAIEQKPSEQKNTKKFIILPYNNCVTKNKNINEAFNQCIKENNSWIKAL